MPKSVTGFLEKITKGVTKTGKNVGKNYYKLQVSGLDKSLFVWDFDTIANVKLGDEVDFMVEENGNFLTAMSAVPVIRVGEAPKYAIGEPPAAPSMDLKNLYMARESALKTAAEFSKMNREEDLGVEGMVAIAKRFFEYIETGE